MWPDSLASANGLLSLYCRFICSAKSYFRISFISYYVNTYIIILCFIQHIWYNMLYKSLHLQMTITKPSHLLPTIFPVRHILILLQMSMMLYVNLSMYVTDFLHQNRVKRTKNSSLSLYSHMKNRVLREISMYCLYILKMYLLILSLQTITM